MIKSSSFFLLYATFWYFTWVTEVKSLENALVFDPANVKLLELNDKYQVYPVVFLLACPPSAEEDKELRPLDKYASFSGTGIYMYSAHVKPKQNTANQVIIGTNPKVCETQYQPVMVQDKLTSSYETGYELFYYDDGFTFKLPYGKYDRLQKITNEVTSKGEYQSYFSKRREYGRTIFQVYLDNDSPYDLTYFWISVLSIQVSKQQRQIRFMKDEINDYKTTFSCGDFSLEDPEKTWNDNEDKLSTQEKNTNIEGSSSKQAEDPWQQIQIMSFRYFHSLSAKLATCTYLNLAHVTKSIAERLEQVDLYLYSMYRAWPSQIDIIFGVTGKSEEIPPEYLPSVNNEPKIEKLRKFPIPAPQISYRIVEYKVNNETLNALVVIHNFLGVVSNEERICPPEAELKGWSGLGHGYACPVTSKTIQKLGVKYDKIFLRGLDLNEDQQKDILKLKQSVTLKATDKQIEIDDDTK